MIGGAEEFNRKMRAMLFVSAAKLGHLENAQFVYNFRKETSPWEFGQQSSEHLYESAALYDALYSPEVETLKFVEGLREIYPIWSNTGTMLEYRLLGFARSGNLAGTSFLLSQGVDARGSRNWHIPYITNEPIITACEGTKANIAVIDLLIQHDADPDVKIAAAASRGRTVLVRQLLDRGIKQISALSGAEKGPFHDTTRLLLDAGVDPNESIGSNSPLVNAISMEHTGLFKILVERGADLNTPGTAEKCVKRARKDGMKAILKLLEEHGVDVSANFDAPSDSTRDPDRIFNL